MTRRRSWNDLLGLDMPALREAMQGLDSTALREAMQGLDSTALREAMQGLPRLDQGLFGEAWDERLAAAVRRLERAEDILDAAPDPERAVEALARDTDTVREAAPPDSLVNAAPLPIGDDTCGTITPAPTMLTFAGTTAQFLQTATSDGCGNFEVVGTLTRQ